MIYWLMYLLCLLTFCYFIFPLLNSFILFSVKFVDFKMGAETGYLRFDEPEASQKARAAAVLAKEGGLAVKNFIAILEPVTGKNTFSASILSFNYICYA